MSEITETMLAEWERLSDAYARRIADGDTHFTSEQAALEDAARPAIPLLIAEVRRLRSSVPGTTGWRSIYERMFEKGPGSFSAPERETIRTAIEEAFHAGWASRSPGTTETGTRDPREPAPKVHSLKTWPAFFREVREGRKRFEIRRNDRGYAVGDVLVLQEWNPDTQIYTREMVSARVTYMVQGEWGLPADVCVMSLEPLAALPVSRGDATTEDFEEANPGSGAPMRHVASTPLSASPSPGSETPRPSVADAERLVEEYEDVLVAAERDAVAGGEGSEVFEADRARVDLIAAIHALGSPGGSTTPCPKCGSEVLSTGYALRDGTTGCQTCFARDNMPSGPEVDHE